MPVIADIDEPPAKCCKYCEESTHGVDGPASWRLTLDQDLIDTLKGSFPSWFQSTTTTTASNSAASTTTITTPTHNIINNHNNCATQITIDTSNHHHHHHSHHHHILNHHNRLHHQNNNTLHHLNGNSLLSSSASPASSIASISSTASSKKSSSSCSSSSSSSSSCSSSSSSSSTSSSSSSSLSCCNNNNNSKNNNNSSINNIKNNGNHTTNKNHNNNSNNNNNSNSNKTIRILNKSAKSKTASATIKTTKASISPIFSSSSSHSLGGGSSLLATFSSPTSATVELISDSSCNGLLTTTTTRLSGKHFAQTFQDVILLHEAYDDMSEGEQCLNASVLGSSDDGTNSDSYDPRQSPPKAIVDSSPLQPAMDKNKESLKVKLMVRRPHSQLVEQGIIPPLKTSPAIHEQCKQLERAKTSDLLKAKIQQRPNREDLERLHILEEDECHIDPSLAEKQRMLKKARLADQLNSQIQHRPGPLELIKKNILHTEKPIEKIVKEGLVSFKATSEGLLTRPQHPSKYITFEDDSQSSESDTRQTPPRSEENALPASGGDMLQAAAASAGIVTVALTIPTSGGQVVVSSPPLLQTKTFQSTNNTILQPYVPPPPPLPPSTITPVTTRHSQPNAIQVKQETANLFEELCQSVAGPNAQSPCHGLSNFLPMIPSPLSLGSTTSTLSPLSSVASPTQSLTPRPPPIQSPALQLHIIGAPKSDAPGKDKNRKKSKSKPVSKARTIKFHEYKGPPSAAAKLSSESSVEETSYQLMLEQQNCLLKFLETLNKNQSIIPAAGTPGGSVTGAVNAKTVQSTGNGVAGFSSNTTVVPPLNSPAPAMLMTNDGSSNTSSSGGSTFSIITTPRPPPIPSPALSVSSSIPPSPATSYAESTCSLSDLTRLEKMKVSDLKMQLKRRNLPVSGPKPQLIERLKPYLPLESMDCASSNVTITSVSTPVSTLPTEVTINSATCPGDAVMEANSSTVPDTPMAMIVNSPRPVEAMDEEQMDIVQQVDSPLPVSLQSVGQPQPQTATIMLSNEDLLREQQRKIDELQRQLQRSQQELQQIRQKQHQQQQHHQQQTVTAQLVNAVPTQQITLITTTTAAPQQTLTVLPQQIKKETTVVPTKIRQSKSNVTAASVPAANPTAVTGTMTQKMVVKQQLEAKIQKQKQAAAAAAAAQAQVKAQAQAQAQAKAQAQAFAQAQAQAMVQAQPQIRLLTQKTQTVLIPTTTTPYATTVAKIDDPKPTRQKNSNAPTNTATTTTSTIIANQIPLTAKTNTTHHHNNLGLVWNEGNQTIFLVGLNDQHMTAHTIGNISLAGASPATKKLLNGHQRTSSLPSIVFPIRTTTPMHENLIETKPIITQQQFQQLQQQQQIHQPQQLIQLDIKPTGLPPPPPPPPQYEEATKQLAAKSHKSMASNLHMPNIKIKEEPNLTTSSTQTISKVANKSKAVIKSEKLTDVLDILIKQGELPESALEPITPVTPLTPGGSNTLMTDMSGNLIFSTDISAGSGHLVPKLEPQVNAEASPSHTSTVVLPMDITPSSQQQQQQQQQASNDVFQLLSNASAATAGSLTASTPNFIENIDMASPLQPDCHIDAESVAKTLDIFLEQHHHSTPPSSVATPHHQSSPIHHHHDMLAKPASCSSPEKSSLNHSPDDEEKLHHFDEFELLELMSQQLEMDIGDDGNGFGGNGSNSGSCSSLQHHQYHHHADKVCNSSPVILNGLKRDMNPSLQPSISDLIQQQLNHTGNNNSNSSPTHQTSTANSEAAAEAAALAATGGITDFDFVDQLNQHHNHHHHQHQQQHNQQQQHSGNNNNHSILHNGGNGSNHDVDDDDVVSHFVSTPMDVCDDFDNPLGSFSFTSLSPDSNINTPPHPFGSGNTGVNGANGGSSTCGMAAAHAANSGQLHHNHHSQSMSEQMSICGTSGGTVSTDSTSDAFSSGDNILDLFNIDDYKMSWGEGDFAV